MMNYIATICVIILIGILVISDTINAGEIQRTTVPRNASFVDVLVDEPSSEIIETKSGRRGRRLVVNDEECTLYELAIETKDSLYDETTDESIPQKDDDYWLCQFDKTYSKEVLGLDDPLVRITGWSPEENPSKAAHANLVGRDRDDDIDVGDIIESGRTKIKVKQAVIDREEQTMYMGSDFVQVVKDEDHLRRLQSDDIKPIVGNRRVVVVRISTNDFKYVPAVTGTQIQKFIFNNDRGQVTMRRKFFECSYRRLKMLPYKGFTKTGIEIKEGFANVKLNGEQSAFVKDLIENGGEDPLSNRSNRERVLSYCRQAAEARLGDLESQFDHVMFVLPNQLELLALAIIGRWDSYYGWSWILRPSMPLHEIGHNLGLDHAGEINIYDDKVGYMGFSYDNKDGPSMCYNPANSFFLGWYKKATDSYNAQNSGAEGKLFTLNGIADYKPRRTRSGDNKPLVVLRLTQSGRQWDYYVGYNRAKGINKGTEENKDEIVIVRKNGPAGSLTTTKKIATLSTRPDRKGRFVEIEDYNGGGSIFITYEDKKRSGRDIIIRISTSRPTDSPSASPTWAPSGSPSAIPTPEPSISLEPSGTPSRSPTAAPTKQPTYKPTFLGELVDRDDFRYQNNPRRDCDWIAENLERCSFTSQRKYVQTYWCKKTCEDANWCLGDKDNFVYREDFNQDCSWVAQSPTVRCDIIWRNKAVSDYWCQETCNPGCNKVPANANIITLRRRQGDNMS